MGENENRQKMAEILSNDLFKEFFWRRTGPTNVDWECVDKENHGNGGTHPVDVVFYYDEPYKKIRTYIHCDLKSYGDLTIQSGTLRNSFYSLCKQVACAEKSEDWQHNFLHDDNNYQVHGLLFVYNHDGHYERNFKSHFNEVEFEKVNIPKGSRIFVMGPEDIYWINNVAKDLRALRGDDRLPSRSNCSFFYPQPVRKANININHSLAANLEMLSSPWVIMRFKDEDSEGVVIYFRDEAIDESPFLYLIDYLRHYQLLTKGMKILVRMIEKKGNQSVLFSKAKQSYLQRFGTGVKETELAKIIDGISFSTITDVAPVFSQHNVGMGDE